MKTYTKESLIDSLLQIRKNGWVENERQGNDGGVGNTLEDLLEIEENNLPIPNAAEWELKCQKNNTSALTTLIHVEPSPRAMRFVPHLFLPKYGWRHKNAGLKYPDGEKSFRQTIHALNRSDRGFKVIINNKEQKVEVSFDANFVSDKHKDWLQTIETVIGLGDLQPRPYWGFDDLLHRIGSKLHNCFYIGADVKRIDGVQYYHYNKIMKLEKLSTDGIMKALRNGNLLVDFDARTGHNHGTKFRLRQNKIHELYNIATEL